MKRSKLRQVLHFSTSITALVFLGGCVSATSIYQNEELSEEVKGREYGEVYFLSPKEDPRNITPRIVNEFKSMGYNVMEMDRERPLEGVQGTGFFISTEGHILTCQHVIDEETTATVWVDEKRYEADLVASDEELDLAIIKLRTTPSDYPEPLFVDSGTEPMMGDEVYTIGYPMADLLGDQARLTKGLVSAAQGLKGSEKQVQITAAIQPGNSGGPVFEQNGAVRGVVTQTLNTLAILKASGGTAPQNVNFALKPSYINDFLEKHLAGELLVNSGDERSISSVQEAVVKVRSGIIPQYLENKPKLVIIFDYNGIWDMWYRFNVFLVSAFDFETQERIFTAGQVGDNVISSEEVVINDTLAQIREALGKPPATP
ncbi:MAG: serine protease [Verrucomicrobiota bacterium]